LKKGGGLFVHAAWMKFPKGLIKRGVSCSVDLLIAKALEITEKKAAPPVGFSFDSWKLPHQHAPSFNHTHFQTA